MEYDQITENFKVLMDQFKNTYSHLVDFPEQSQNNPTNESLIDNKPITQQSLFQNIISNSFLKRNGSLKSFSNQVKESYDEIIEMLKSEDEVEYTIENILTLINLQLSINPQKFNQLSSNIKLKLICLLFAKFVNKEQIAFICKDFYSYLDIDEKLGTYLKRY